MQDRQHTRETQDEHDRLGELPDPERDPSHVVRRGQPIRPESSASVLDLDGREATFRDLEETKDLTDVECPERIKVLRRGGFGSCERMATRGSRLMM